MNKGLKESHIHISNNVDIINYNINLTSTNNNIILNIPFITTLNKIIDLSLINNHLDNDKIYDLGYGN